MSIAPYLEHFSDADLSLLAAAAGNRSAADLLSDLRANAGYLEALLSDSRVFAALFASPEHDALLRASPFLIFAILIHRAAADLARTGFVQEWVAPGRRVPMFQVEELRDFARNSVHRLFLAELLASYTHVASGSFLVQTARGWRRRRFSELDPMRFIELIEVAPERERPTLYRRLGDLSLFLTGVFPDHAGRLLPPAQRGRLGRILTQGRSRQSDAWPAPVSGDLGLLEQLGRRSYRLAWQATDEIGGARSTVLTDFSERFDQARRTLNFVTDRYLFPFREQWFSLQ